MICILKNAVLYYIQVKLRSQKIELNIQKTRFLTKNFSRIRLSQNIDGIFVDLSGKEYINAFNWADH